VTPLPTIRQAAAAIRQQQLTPLTLVESCLAQIQQYEPQVRAWAFVDEAGALALAKCQTEEAARGHLRGPLHGIPLGIKDLFDVAGMPTEAGSPLRKGRIAKADAPLVARLRAAGAIILGKTVTVQFAAFDPPPTRNPWNFAHTPGGSSSGSAAALAAGMCLGALGTQTGGSLVRPASYCGVTACKPTAHSLSTQGVVPLSWNLDHPGPMARCVDDLASLWQCLIDPSPASVELTTVPRLALVENFFLERAKSVITQASRRAVGVLQAAGASLPSIRLPIDWDRVLDMHWRIMAVDAVAYHRANFLAHRDSYGPMITSLLDDGLRTSAVDYSLAIEHRRQSMEQAGELLGDFDALLMPATDSTAPPRLDTTGTRLFQAVWSYTGLPVVSLPCGLADDGMPAAMQLVGRPGCESALLAVARWCEAQWGVLAGPQALA